MNVVHLVAGAGAAYCGSCLHGHELARSLQALGHDTLIVPLYTPLHTEGVSATESRHYAPLKLGGINVYLQQKWALFRHLPRLVSRTLDWSPLVRLVTRRAASTQPESLGALTVSVLQGEEGRQRRELDRLVDFLATQPKPDVVHLSNVLLVGVAREIHRRLKVPVVCSLTGEDLFVEQLPEPFLSQARDLLRRRSADLAALVAMNGYYADFMAEYLDYPREKIHVIHPGLNLDGYPVPPDGGKGDAEKGDGTLLPERPEGCFAQKSPVPFFRDDQTITIGYLARICPDKGLHQLAEAFALLADDETLPKMRLRAAGQLNPADRPYLRRIERQLANAGLADRFDYAGVLSRDEKIRFLESLDLMSVPTVYRESKGLPIIEAWAAGVPVVLPAHGAFIEMVQDTGGGLLCNPDDPAALAAGLKRLIQNPEQAAQCGRRGQRAVHERYHTRRMARETVAMYEQLLGEGPS
ncbi:MAG: glycosyltransferase family 4 protein [Planctomycetes bacterium]|nr:glycosyltransferase family 4 protein [Planctomycetota bacterium]